MPRRCSELDYARLARRKKVEFLGPVPENTLHETRWRCKTKGHEFIASYKAVYEGKGCLVCNRLFRPKTEEEYIRLGQENGLAFVGLPEGMKQANLRDKVLWRTASGHLVMYSWRDLAERRHPVGQRGYNRSERFYNRTNPRQRKKVLDKRVIQ